MKPNRQLAVLALLLSIIRSPFAVAVAQGTSAFTYQGRLNDGPTLANGLYDFQCTVYNDSQDPGAYVSGTNTFLGVGVTNGLFTITPDFGYIFDGQELWLGIAVRAHGIGAYTLLSPFQPLTPTPYALYADQAFRAQLADFLNGKLPASQISGTIASSNIGVGTITSSNLAPGAAAANLANSGLTGVPSSGIVLSEKEINPALLNSGFLPIGTTISVSGETWTNIPSGPPATGAFNPGRYNHQAVWTGTYMLVIGGYPDNVGLRYNPSANTWTAINKTGAPPISGAVLVAWTGTLLVVWDPYLRSGGRYNPSTDTWSSMSAPGAPAARHGASAAWTGTYLVVWGGHDENTGTAYGDGARYNPTTDTWTAISSTGAPTGRDDASAVWSGTEVIFFGGKTTVHTLRSQFGNSYYYDGDQGWGDGGRYNPTTDSWSPVSTNDLRFNHTAVWTGSRMLVFGGWNEDAIITPLTFGLSSSLEMIPSSPAGASYNPANNTWTPISTTGAAAPRASHVAVWDGTHMLVWGGEATNSFLNNGASYTPASDTWTSLPAVGSAPRIGHAAVWTGTQMIWWGGRDSNGSQLSDGLRYTLSGNTWSTMSTPPASGEPAERSEATYVWTGSQLIVWGGVNGATVLRSGGIYTPGVGWTNTPDDGAPSARVHHTAVWTGKDMIIWGGQSYGASAPVNTGARFNVASNHWYPVSTIGAPRARTRHSAVWTGKEMIVWGGYDYTNAFYPIYPITGGRYDPATDVWTQITNTLFSLYGREQQTAVWTGTNMLIWGGFFNSGGFSPTLTFYNDGYRYDPASNVWSLLPAAPIAGRRSHGSIWGNGEMMIWGGYTPSGATNNGARYNPASNTWTLISSNNAPAARLDHSTVWAESKNQMIAWGGTDNINYLHDGSFYDPATDKWTTITNSNSGLIGRSTHGAAWTGSNMIVLDGYNYNGSIGTNLSDGAVFTPRKLYYLYQKP